MKTRLFLMLLAALCLPLLLGGSAFPGTARDGSSPEDRGTSRQGDGSFAIAWGSGRIVPRLRFH